MKDAVQAKLAAEWQGLTDEEVRARVRHDLETSDSIVARWWRRARQCEETPETADR
jgi:hypothetical protein